MAAAVLVMPSMMDAYLGDVSRWPQKRPVRTHAPIPKQTVGRDITVMTVV